MFVCVQNFKSISSNMAEMWHKIFQKQALFTSFRDFTMIFLILFFLTDFDASKSVLGPFFELFAKIWPINMYRSSKSPFFTFVLLYLMTWIDLDLYYVHKAQKMMLTNVSNAIHADSLALFALNIKIVPAKCHSRQRPYSAHAQPIFGTPQIELKFTPRIGQHTNSSPLEAFGVITTVWPTQVNKGQGSNFVQRIVAIP